MEFETILSQIALPTKKVVAVAAAEDEVVLQTVCQAFDRNIATPILCGNKTKICALAEKYRLDISGFEVINSEDAKQAAETAVQLVKQGKADILMKGLIQTADILRAVLKRENGLRTSAVLSHVSILHSPILNRILLLTDAAMIPYPDISAKVEIIKNAIIAAKGLGIHCPKIAPLAAVEIVNSNMPATIDAAMLTVMNHRGQITDCVIDGPLAMDLAISEDAAIHKGIKSEVAGKADILLFHNIEAANSTLKTFIIAGNCLFGGLVIGAAAPIVLTSRSDSAQSKLYSLACAASIVSR